MGQFVSVQSSGGLATIRLDRPPVNALSIALQGELKDAAEQVSADPDIRAAVIYGGARVFAAGADVKEMADKGSAEMAAISRRLHTSFRTVAGIGKPVVAAITGFALGGGLELALCADFRVAGESARFGVSEARWGLFPLGGSAVRLPRQIPYTVAADLLLTGRHITAAEALAIGLIGHVVPDGQALTKAMEIAEVIAANGPVAVRAILRTIRETEGMPEAEAFKLEAQIGMTVFRSDDAKEGPRAFTEKRKPEFRDR